MFGRRPFGREMVWAQSQLFFFLSTRLGGIQKKLAPKRTPNSWRPVDLVPKRWSANGCSQKILNNRLVLATFSFFENYRQICNRPLNWTFRSFRKKKNFVRMYVTLVLISYHVFLCNVCLFFGKQEKWSSTIGWSIVGKSIIMRCENHTEEEEEQY